MNKELLLRTAEVMDRVEYYDQSEWIDQMVLESQRFEEDGKMIYPEEGFCNTAACWLGSCAVSPIVPEIWIKRWGTDRDRGPGMPAAQRFTIENANGDPRMAYGDEDLVSLFDIPRTHYNSLVDGSADCNYGFFHWANNYGHEGDLPRNKRAGPKHVATAIRKYVETDGQIMEDYLDWKVMGKYHD